jgi:VanZ family protein
VKPEEIEEGRSLSVQFARFAAWILAATIALLTLVPPAARPTTALPHDLEHAAIFAAAGAAFAIAYRSRLFSLIKGAILYAAVLELAQFLVPGRHARIEDFVVDAASSCGMIIVCDIVLRAPSSRAGGQ